MQNLHDRLYTIARFSVVFVVALLPTFAIPVDWVLIAQSKGLLIGVVLIAAVIFWVAGSVAEGLVRIPKSTLLLASALLPIAYIVSAVLTGASWESYVGDATSVDTVAAALAFYLLFVITASLWVNRSTRILLYALLVSGSVLGLFSIARLFVSNEWTNLGGALAGVATSTVGSWHDLGIFLALLMFLTLTVFSAITDKRYVRFALHLCAALFALMLVVINLGDTWYGISALFGAYGLFQLTLLRGEGAGWRATLLSRASIYVAIALIACGLGYGGVWIQERLPQSLQVAHVEVRPSWKGTITVGEHALTGRELFFGTGPNTFVRDWSLYKPQNVNVTEFWGVDFASGVGTVPTSVVTVGLFGALAWGLIILPLLFLVFRREMRKDRIGFALVAAALFLTAYQVLYTPGIALSTLTFVMYGLLVAHRVRDPGNTTWDVPVGVGTIRGCIVLAVVCAIALLSLGIGVQSIRRLVSDSFINRSVRVYETTKSLDTAVQYVTLANSIYPNNDRAHRMAVELGLLELRALIAAGVQSEEAQQTLRETLSRTIENALTATTVEKGNYQNWLVLAKLYGELAGSKIEGAETNARQAYERVREINPTSPLPLLGLAQLELLLENSNSARELLLRALQLKPNLPIAHFLLSQIEAGAGDFTRAREAAVSVAELAPEDPLAWYNLGTILYAAKDYPAASLALERAVALQASYANALFVLALTYYELDDEERALATLKTLQTRDPSHELLGRAIENIENGQAPLAPLSTQ